MDNKDRFVNLILNKKLNFTEMRSEASGSQNPATLGTPALLGANDLAGAGQLVAEYIRVGTGMDLHRVHYWALSDHFRFFPDFCWGPEECSQIYCLFTKL